MAKTQLNDTKTVKLILEEIENFFRKFWQLKRNNPKNFEVLLWSEDFYKEFVSRKEMHKSETNSPLKNDEELELEAAFRLLFTPERELFGLTQFLESYKKIWKAGCKAGNEEISRYVIYNLINLLFELTQEKENQIFVEQFLRILNSISVEAIQEFKKSKNLDSSIYFATIDWYTEIVFKPLEKNNKGFDLSYLEIFNKYLFSILRYIISEEQTIIFNYFVASLVEGIHLPSYYKSEIFEYEDIILKRDYREYKKLDERFYVRRKVLELSKLQNELNTQKKLETWLKKFDELKAIIEGNLDEEQKNFAEEIEKKIKYYVISQFKYQNLLNIVFIVGAYCLFKKKYGYIKYLWEYKQPPDSNISWSGHDIIPSSLDELIKFYFGKNLFEKRLDFEGRHGSDKYYKKYFLLLLTRAVQSISSNTQGKSLQTENYKLPDLHVYTLNDIKNSIDEFINLSSEIKKDKNMLVEVGFDITKLDQIIDFKLVSFLKKIKEEAEEKISVKHKAGNISQERIDEFKSRVIESFYMNANLRDIFTNYLKTYENKTKEKIIVKKGRFGINIVDDKALFFDEWFFNNRDLGKAYGRDLALGEDSYLIDIIAKDCKEVLIEDFEKVLLSIKNPEGTLIFATRLAISRFFEDLDNFIPKWKRNIKQLNNKGFGGWFKPNNRRLIPVFEINHKEIDNQILILNKLKLGRLVQLSPLNKGEKEEFVEDIFYMNIQAFSQNEKLMDEFVRKPPEWLERIRDESKKRDYLSKRVLIQIIERFDFNKSREFEGYKLFLK